MNVPRGYVEQISQLLVLFRIWIDRESVDRFVNLQFYHWGSTVLAAPLHGRALKLLCATPDAEAMCTWADEHTSPPKVVTLLQALVAVEMMGLKEPGKGPPPPPEAFRGYAVVPLGKGGSS